MDDKVITAVSAAAAAAAHKLGYSALKAKQMEVAMGIMSGCDVFVILPTGHGKCMLLLTLYLRHTYVLLPDLKSATYHCSSSSHC